MHIPAFTSTPLYIPFRPLIITENSHTMLYKMYTTLNMVVMIYSPCCLRCLGVLNADREKLSQEVYSICSFLSPADGGLENTGTEI